ncbi:MAG TPA: KH domain-containing protein [Thermoanaerobaculia bacterium]|nr:KH domain-containing protein [Thermoanaerobaculia bacterium]
MPDARRVRDDLIGVLRLLVDHPERLEIRAAPMRRATVFEVATAAEDLGKVIGRRGRAIRALRTLLDARAEADGEQYGLEVLEQ